MPRETTEHAPDPTRPRRTLRAAAALAALGLAAAPALAQSSAAAPGAGVRTGERDSEPDAQHAELDPSVFSSLRARSIGPALMSGRIGDFAVNPDNHNHYFVAVHSGNVWKTTNAGVTYEPVFESYGSYSIGCLALDHDNPNVLWVGTGENNSQRSVSWGDGIYKTTDGGKSFTNMGLRESEHIGMIVIHPDDSDVVYVAAQGPLWRPGGDRGLYKTSDGGETWSRILHISEDTGVNEVHMDPRDPDILYASAYQRRRAVWTLINGGPESGIYKSTDGGDSWREITAGLPDADMGCIGMDISPANPDVVYAMIEAADDQGGVYRSTDRGETWTKRSPYVSGSPQYFQEIFCDPHNVDRLYAMDVWSRVSEDGGATFNTMMLADKHVDDHAMWINPDDTDHLRIGSDGGVYETWDRGANWHYKANLPVTQFYRVAVDNSEPFYYVYGGTQDNNTQGGPSRTTDRVGITNDHWFITVGGDGFEPAVDPSNPDIVYSQWQYGGLVRFDRKSGEIVDIKPQHIPGEDPIVWNWDSPLIISPHDPARLYYAGDKLYRSDDRGNSWTRVSPDLSRQIDRNELEVMGRIQSIDAVAKHDSTSIYGNIVALDESPLREGLIYAGTDDGLIHVTENGGDTWRRIDAFPGIPHLSYVAGITASIHNPDRVYALFDNHKRGDFSPYVLRSDDRGHTWNMTAGDLPDDHVCYTIREDHERDDLLFIGTEFAAFFSVDAGEHWHKVGGVPTIAVQDIEIQRRENDLVMATFGRGFYILDDYTPIRHATPEAMNAEAHIFPVKDALRYIESSRLGMRSGRGFQGASYYAAENPPYGAVFTLHLKDGYTTTREDRKKIEASKVHVDYPTLEQSRTEDRELEPRVVLTVTNSDGDEVRRVEAPRSKGLHRVAWDLRYADKTPIELRASEGSPWSPPSVGPLAAPGVYTVNAHVEHDGERRHVAGPVDFNVVPLNLSTFAAEDKQDVLDFQLKVSRLRRAVTGAMDVARDAQSRIAHIRKAVEDTPGTPDELLRRADALRLELADLMADMRGDPTISRRDEPQPPAITNRLGTAVWGTYYVTSAPTQTQRDQYRYAADAFQDALAELADLVEDRIPAIEAELDALGVPHTPGRVPEWEPEHTSSDRASRRTNAGAEPAEQQQ